MNIKPK